MKCPVCDSKLEVTNSRLDGNNGSIVRRKRECPECYTRFDTVEKIDYSKLNRYTLDKIHDRIDGHGIRNKDGGLYGDY